MSKNKIVILDQATLGDVEGIEELDQFGEVVSYDFTQTEEETVQRLEDTDIALTNKVVISEKVVKSCPNLKLVCVLATGTNNIDFNATESKGIIVKNVSGYSTHSVTQHTFSMLFHLLEHLSYYQDYSVEQYAKSPIFTNLEKPFFELKDKVFGIIGLGNIGRNVAKVAEAFGARVIYYSTSGKNNNSDYLRVDLDELLKKSDVVSIHAPLTEETKHLIGVNELKKMKNTSILLNTGRGGIVVEEDLAKALHEDLIMGAGIDVLEQEPINQDNPLLDVSKDKLIITPHIAWASQEARNELMKLTINNIKEYLKQ